MITSAMIVLASLLPVQEIDRTKGIGPRVETVMRDGRAWYTVSAQNASALRVVRDLGRLSGRELYGLEALARPAIVTVDLEERPLDQVLEYLLGSLGLRFELQPASITLIAPGAVSVEEQLDLAAAAWMRASQRFPEYSAAAEARLAQGEIAERQGMPAAARSHYLSLIEDYPTSAVVGEAYIRAARLSVALGRHGEASRLFRELANSDVAVDYHADARLELARSLVTLGDPQSALYMLSALDANFPSSDRAELALRRLVKARALNETGQHMQALEEIDRVDQDLDADATHEAFEVRAIALEGVGMPGEAARAWLLHADGAEGREQSFAFEEAARLSLEAGDELAVLFVVQEAGDVRTERLAHYEGVARRRLSLADEVDRTSPEACLERAALWMEQGDAQRAGELIEPFYLRRADLGEDLHARVSIAWASCVEVRTGLRAAIEVLRIARGDLQTVGARRQLDRAAAQMFESYDRFDDAIEAYQGRYARP